MTIINVKDIPGKVSLPAKGTEKSAGYDIIASEDPIVIGEIGRELTLEDGTKIPLYKNIQYLEYHTQLFVAPQSTNKHILVFPRSSSRKYNLAVANSIGLIDNDYRGEILVSFRYIFQPEDFVIEFDPMEGGGFKPKSLLGGINWSKVYRKGDKIGQLVSEDTDECNYVFVPELTKTDRGEGGHGSTGQQANIPPQSKEEPFSLGDRYNQAGGIPIRKRYSDEMKERERVEGSQKSTNKINLPPPGIHERKSK